MTSLLNIGISGLRAQQAALNVVGQNITNASTPGYSRQRAELSTAIGSEASGQFSAAGVEVVTVKRIADSYIEAQLREDLSLQSSLDALSGRLNQLERAVFDDDYGLDRAMGEFFDALQQASLEPSDLSARRFVLSSAESLVNRFRSMADNTRLLGDDVSSSLESSVIEANELVDKLANINQRIAALDADNSASARNVLLDQREVLLNDLSALVSVSTIEQDDGQISVFVAKGQPLLLGQEVSQLEVTRDGEIAIDLPGIGALDIITRSISGGDIGGLVDYRNNVLRPAQNTLGQIAAALSEVLNTQHELGVDPKGNFGQLIFRDVNDPALVFARSTRLEESVAPSSSGQMAVYLEDPLAHEASDYVMSVAADGASFTIQRERDDELVFQSSSLSVPSTFSFDGIRVELTAGEFEPGDRFLIRPYAENAREMQLVLEDPNGLAFAAPATVEKGPANQGSAEVRVAKVLDPDHPIFGDDALMPPLAIEFISGNEYRILDNTDPARPVPLSPDLGLQTLVTGAQNHILPDQLGTSVVNASGPNLARLVSSGGFVANLDAGANGYPGGSFTLTDEADGETLASVTVASNASAEEIAARLSTLAGVSASAQNRVTLSDLSNDGGGTEFSVAVNGETFTGFTTLAELADAMTASDALAAQGISAKSDGTTLVLESLRGGDLNLHVGGDSSDGLVVTNLKGESLSLIGNGPGSFSRVTVGGTISALVDPERRLGANVEGVFAADPVHARADLGIDLVLSGRPEAGDRFLVNLNQGSPGDNRNALALAQLGETPLIGSAGKRTFGGEYGSLVQAIGSASSQAQINLSAAEALVTQSQAHRESVSGVNLDEEAADLIRFEQAYNASAQVIAVARDVFNTLLSSVT